MVKFAKKDKLEMRLIKAELDDGIILSNTLLSSKSSMEYYRRLCERCVEHMMAIVGWQE